MTAVNTVDQKVVFQNVNHIRFVMDAEVIGMAWLSQLSPEVGFGINIYKKTAKIELYCNDGSGWTLVWTK